MDNRTDAVLWLKVAAVSVGALAPTGALALGYVADRLALNGGGLALLAGVLLAGAAIGTATSCRSSTWPRWWTSLDDGEYAVDDAWLVRVIVTPVAALALLGTLAVPGLVWLMALPIGCAAATTLAGVAHGVWWHGHDTQTPLRIGIAAGACGAALVALVADLFAVDIGIVLGALTLCAAALLWRAVGEPGALEPAASTRNAWHSWRAVWPRRTLGMHIVTGLVALALFWAGALFRVELRAYPQLLAGALLLLVCLVVFPRRPARLGTRRRRRVMWWVIVCQALTVAPAWGLAMSTDEGWWRVALWAVFITCIVLCLAPARNVAIDGATHRGPGMTAWLTFAGCAGFTTGPQVVATLPSSWHYYALLAAPLAAWLAARAVVDSAAERERDISH